jgi:hypothetical protein
VVPNVKVAINWDNAAVDTRVNINSRCCTEGRTNLRMPEVTSLIDVINDWYDQQQQHQGGLTIAKFKELIAEPAAESAIKTRLTTPGFMDSLNRAIANLEGRAAEKHLRKSEKEF